MTVGFAILSTICIGLGEFFASGVTGRARSTEVTAAMFLSGVLGLLIIVPFWPGDPSSRDLAFGALAGLANGVGILLLYLAYSRGSLRSAAPAAAVVMSGIPVGWDVLISGASPSTITGIGLAIGVTAIALSSYEGGGDAADDRSSVPIAMLAGAVFGILLILLAEVSDDGGGTPILVQRIVALSLTIVVARATGPRVLPAIRRDLAVSLGVGVFATAAIVLFVLALEGGSLSVTSVIGSQYAAVAVLLGVVFRGQRMWWWQAVGLAGASASVALVAIG